MLLTSEDNGYLYIYGFDTAEGGDCHLIRQFHLTSTDHCGSSVPSSQPPPTRKSTSESSNSGSAADQLHPEESVTKSSEGEEVFIHITLTG